MAKKDYKNSKLISFICVIGALVGVVFAILKIVSLDLENILYGFLGLVFSVVVLIQVLKPDDPIPYHWLLFIIFGILIAIFAGLPSLTGGLVAGIIIIIGGLVALIDVL